MTHDDVPRGLETANLCDELHSVDSGQKATYTVSIRNTRVCIETIDDDSIQIVGVERFSRRKYADGETTTLTEIYATYVVGENNDWKYLVPGAVISITSITYTENEPDDETEAEEEKKAKVTSKRLILSTGKRVTTSGGDEQIAWKKSFRGPGVTQRVGYTSGRHLSRVAASDRAV